MTDNFIMPFAGGAVDPVETQRSAAELQAFLAKPNARCIMLHKGAPALAPDGSLKRIHPSELIGRNLMDPGPIFLGLELGLEKDTPLFAASVANPEKVAPEDAFQNLARHCQSSKPRRLSAGRAREISARLAFRPSFLRQMRTGQPAGYGRPETQMPVLRNRAFPARESRGDYADSVRR